MEAYTLVPAKLLVSWNHHVAKVKSVSEMHLLCRCDAQAECVLNH